jgi:hypothetical protein
MLVGGAPTALAAWLIFFWPCYKAVARYQAHRAARRERARTRRGARQQAKAARAEAKETAAAAKRSAAGSAEAKGEQS